MPYRYLTVFFFALAFSGCTDQLPESIGPARKLIVLADAEDWKTLESPLRDIFETVIYTPQEEKLFEVERGDVRLFYEYKHAIRKSLMIIAPINADHPTAQFLKELLSPEVQQSVKDGQTSVFWKNDIWAQDQILMIVSGADLPTLSDNLLTHADRLKSSLEHTVDQNVVEYIYSFGEREALTKELIDNFGFGMRVPFGYHILESYPDSGFVALAKESPNRWLFVYTEKNIHPDLLTDDWCIQKRNEITKRFFGGDHIGDVTVRHEEFVGKLAVVLQGLWENEEAWKGGPFKSYAFVDSDQNRFFYIDIGLYAPNKQKASYLHQIDLIAKTFTSHPLSE